MRYALFLGCTIPVRSTNYELSARKILEKAGAQVVEIESFSCCGFPIRSINARCAELMAANNLAIASKEGLGIISLCSACTSVLTEVNKRLLEDGRERDRINGDLSKLGRSYTEAVSVLHFSRFLYEKVGLDAIRKLVTKDLSSLTVGVHYGCHYTKPSEAYGSFEDTEFPHTIDDLIGTTGARTLDYETKYKCCGGAVLGIDENIALSLASRKLNELKKTYVDTMALVCPFCSVMYDDNQKKIEGKTGDSYDLPVLYLSQLLGLAMGIDPKELGFKMNKVNPQKVIEKISQ